MLILIAAIVLHAPAPDLAAHAPQPPAPPPERERSLVHDREIVPDIRNGTGTLREQACDLLKMKVQEAATGVTALEESRTSKLDILSEAARAAPMAQEAREWRDLLREALNSEVFAINAQMSRERMNARHLQTVHKALCATLPN